MQPNIQPNWLAIAGAVVVSFILGGIWYGPLFGKAWARLVGMPADFKPAPGVMRRAIILQLIGSLLLAYVSTFTLKIWMPTTWGAQEPGGPRWMFGCYHAFFMWLGFSLPFQFGKVAWENRPWKLFFITAGYDLVNFFLISQVIAHG